MKKIIRWLSDISGVTKDIKIETTYRIGVDLKDCAYWFTGIDDMIPVLNTLVIIGTDLKTGYSINPDKVRNEVYTLEYTKTYKI
jgi:hypothetical protein